MNWHLFNMWGPPALTVLAVIVGVAYILLPDRIKYGQWWRR